MGKYAVKLISTGETLRTFSDPAIAREYAKQVTQIGKRPAKMVKL